VDLAQPFNNAIKLFSKDIVFSQLPNIFQFLLSPVRTANCPGEHILDSLKGSSISSNSIYFAIAHYIEHKYLPPYLFLADHTATGVS